MNVDGVRMIIRKQNYWSIYLEIAKHKQYSIMLILATRICKQILLKRYFNEFGAGTQFIEPYGIIKQIQMSDDPK